MREDQVCGIERLTPHFRVKVRPAGLVAARAQNFVEGQRLFRVVVGELVRIPARLIIVPVHVDGAENAKG